MNHTPPELDSVYREHYQKIKSLSGNKHLFSQPNNQNDSKIGSDLLEAGNTP